LQKEQGREEVTKGHQRQAPLSSHTHKLIARPNECQYAKNANSAPPKNWFSKQYVLPQSLRLFMPEAASMNTHFLSLSPSIFDSLSFISEC